MVYGKTILSFSGLQSRNLLSNQVQSNQKVALYIYAEKHEVLACIKISQILQHTNFGGGNLMVLYRHLFTVSL